MPAPAHHRRRRGLVVTATVSTLLLSASAAAAQDPGDNAFTAGGDAALLDLQAVQVPDTGSLAGVGVAETATTGTVTTADSSSRNVNGDVGGQDAVDAVLVLESQAQPDSKVGQFLGVPLGASGGIGVGEGSIVHASAFDATAPCPTGDGQDYTRSIANVESLELFPDAFTDVDERSDVGETIPDGPDGGALDNLLDPVNDGIGQIADQLDPVTDGLDDVVDTIFDQLGLPVPGGALVDISSQDGSGVGSTSAVRLVPGATEGRAGVQVQAVADTLDFQVLGNLIEIDVIRPAGLTVTALGTPGSASVEYQAPVLAISVGGEEVTTIDASQGPEAFEIPMLATISVGDSIETTVGEDGTSVSAAASTARVTVLDPITQGPPAVDLVLGPVTADIADLTPGGLVCGFVEPAPPTPPQPEPQLPVTGGGALAAGLAAMAGAVALRRRRPA